MSTTSPFLSIAYPTRVLSALEEGRVDPFALRQIENDYRPSYLTGNLRIREELPARSYLAQVEIGATALQYAALQLHEQQCTNDIVRAMQGQALIAHQSALQEISQRNVKLDAGFQKLLSVFQTEHVQLRDDLKEGFHALADSQKYVAELVSESIAEATTLIRFDLQNILTVAMRQEHVLGDILKLLRSPQKTLVAEHLNEATRLIALGYTQRGRWKYDTWKDAVSCLQAASAEPSGKTNPIVALHLGIMLWKTHAKLRDVSAAKVGLLSAREAFDRAARLFEKEDRSLSIRSLRHVAHMQYLLGDARGAKRTLSAIKDADAWFDVSFDLARYCAQIGETDEMLHHLTVCLKARPMTATAMFAEPDFRPHFSHLLRLVFTMSESVKKKIQTSATQIKTQIESLNLETLVSRKLGRCNAHKELLDIVGQSQHALGYADLFRLEKRANTALRAMDESTSPHDLLDILAFYRIDEAVIALMRVLIQNPDELEYIEKQDRFAPYLEQLEAERETVASRELQKHKALFDTVSSVVLRLGNASFLCKVLMSSRLGRVYAKTSGTRFLSVHEIREDAVFAQHFITAFAEEYVRTKGNFLYALSSEFTKKYLSIEVARRMDSREQSEFFLSCVANVIPYISHLVPEAYAVLSDILTSVSAKTYVLTMKEKHGLGAYWNVRVPKHAHSKDTELLCNIPHREERGLFGVRHRVPFEEKDGLVLSLLYPSLLLYFEKNESIVSALRSARLEAVHVHV